MKKAKPSKGSARTKRFLDGGAVGALAGLGTLAYLMSRKKKGESEASVPTDKSGYSSGPVDVGRMIEGRGDAEPSAEVKRAMAASQGRPDLIPEGATDADRATMYGDTVAKRVMPKPKVAAKPVAKSVVKVAEKTVSGGSAPKDTSGYAPPARSVASMIEGKGTAEPTAKKPYPQAEATARLKKAEAERRAGQGLTPRAEYTGIGSRKHIEGLRLERSQKLEEEAKKQFEKNKRENEANKGMKRGGKVKKYASGGSVLSASKRADGIAQRGKTKGRIC